MGQRYSFATVLIGKNSLRREGIARVLRCANFRILASLSCADGLSTCKAQSRQLLFLIVRGDDDFDASVEQIELLKKRQPDGRVAVVADHYRLDELVSSFRAGATGYFVDGMSCDAFTKSIELVMMGEAVFPPAFLLSALGANGAAADKAEPGGDSNATIDAPEDPPVQQLSPRERSILRCLIEGYSNKCIARKIGITEATVKVHIKAILRKIRVQNRTQAAIWGINNGSLAQQTDNKPPQLGSVANEQPTANLARKVSDLKHVEEAVPLGAICQNGASHEVERLHGPIRKGTGLRGQRRDAAAEVTGPRRLAQLAFSEGKPGASG